MDRNPEIQNLDPFKNKMSAENLKTLYLAWKQARMQYPGWIILPREIRDEIWRDIQKWNMSIFPNLSKLTSHQERLHLLYELNWRLEKALVPLFTEWVNEIENILQKINPFPSIIKMEKATITPNKLEYQKWEWKTLTEQWIELVFSLVRSAREDQDHLKFNHWLSVIMPVVSHKAEWQARWHYEHCLFHLFRLDQEATQQELKKWKESTELPIWNLKKASLLAELGELVEAERLAQDVLSHIRDGLSSQTENITLLSQEGWAMWLLKLIKHARLFLARESDIESMNREFRDRWVKLSSIHCDPREYLEELKSIVALLDPGPRKEKEIQQNFDPGHATVSSYHLKASDVIRVLPAFSWLRLLEEAGVPMHCGAFVINPESSAKAAECIEPHAPMWALSTMIRSARKKECLKWFAREKVVQLPESKLDYVYELSLRAFQQVWDNFKKNPPQGLLPQTISERLWPLLAELLSRISLRLNPEELERIFQVVIEQYQSPIIYRELAWYDSIQNLFKRLLFAMPFNILVRKIDVLLKLPLPGEKGFQIRIPDKWPEPFHFIVWPINARLDENFDRSDWTASIHYLIKVIQEGRGETRKRAIYRINKIRDIKGLSKQEETDFAQVLWNRENPRTGLPADTGLYNYSFLFLPEPKHVQARERFRKWLLSDSFQSFHLSDGSFGTGPYNILYIKEWLESTQSPLSTFKEYRVDWTEAEAVKLLDKAKAWWDKEKSILNKSVLLFDKPKDCLRYLVDLLGQIILPRLSSAGVEKKTLAKHFLHDLADNGFCVFSALPMILFVDPNELEQVVSQMKDGLNSLSEEEVLNAADGLCRWLAYSHLQARLSKSPEFLFEMLINIVFTRRKPGLIWAIREIASVVDKIPEVLNPDRIERLLKSLEYLIVETSLSEKISEDNYAIPLEKRPESREATANLAFKIRTYFEERDLTIPEIISKWCEIAKTDQLPEVRKVYEAGTFRKRWDKPA